MHDCLQELVLPLRRVAVLLKFLQNCENTRSSVHAAGVLLSHLPHVNINQSVIETLRTK